MLSVGLIRFNDTFFVHNLCVVDLTSRIKVYYIMELARFQNRRVSSLSQADDYFYARGLLRDVRGLYDL